MFAILDWVLLHHGDKAECIYSKDEQVALTPAFSANSGETASTTKQVSPIFPGPCYFSNVPCAVAFLSQYESISEFYSPGFRERFWWNTRASPFHKMTFIAHNNHKNKKPQLCKSQEGFSIILEQPSPAISTWRDSLVHKRKGQLEQVKSLLHTEWRSSPDPAAPPRSLSLSPGSY